MKILFAATRRWTDTASVEAILNSIVGDEPVHVVVAAETRGGPEEYVVKWARQRAKLRRTFIDVMPTGKEYGPNAERSQWVQRRDAHMMKIGGYDLAVVFRRKANTGSNTTRPDDIARMAEEAGIPVKVFDYEQVVEHKQPRPPRRVCPTCGK